MPDKWTTLAAAAAAMNVHPRTIERRIANGKIQSRRTDDGQLQVLADIPDSPVPQNTPLDTVRELANDQISLATGSASAIIRLAEADADRARSELSLVRQEAGRVRQGAQIAWRTVAAMAVLVCVAVGWASFKITQSNDQITTLRDTAERVENEAQKLLTERDTARRDVQAALLSSAEAGGRLAAYTEQDRIRNEADAKIRLAESDKRPTTQPQNLVQRLANVMAGE